MSRKGVTVYTETYRGVGFEIVTHRDGTKSAHIERVPKHRPFCDYCTALTRALPTAMGMRAAIDAMLREESL